MGGRPRHVVIPAPPIRHSGPHFVIPAEAGVQWGGEAPSCQLGIPPTTNITVGAIHESPSVGRGKRHAGRPPPHLVILAKAGIQRGRAAPTTPKHLQRPEPHFHTFVCRHQPARAIGYESISRTPIRDVPSNQPRCRLSTGGTCRIVDRWPMAERENVARGLVPRWGRGGAWQNPPRQFAVPSRNSGVSYPGVQAAAGMRNCYESTSRTPTRDVPTINLDAGSPPAKRAEL